MLRILSFIILIFSLTGLKATERTWHVDPLNGQPGAHGTPALPMATITEALKQIADYEGDAVISLAPGVYREASLVIPQRKGRTTLHGNPGKTFITGADIWTDWEERDGILVADWPYDFGLNPMNGYPEGELQHLQERGRRAEMVFVNNRLLVQVTSAKKLLPGTYLVDEVNDELLLNLLHGLVAKDSLIEVSVRGNLLQAQRIKGLTLRNISFIRAASGANRTGLQKYSVFIAGEHAGGEVDTAPNRDFARDIAIENCQFEWNSSTGVTLANIIGLKVTNSSFDFNGIAGIGANRLKHAQYIGCSFDNNNWRLGLWGGVYGWAPAGTKQLFIADSLFKDCTFKNNYATGLWLDFGNENILVENCIMADNADNGLYIEASAGPVQVKNTRIVRNGYQPQTFPHSGGLLIAESRDITVERCYIADNLHYQIGVRSRTRPSSGYWSGTTFDGHCLNLNLHRSTLIGGVVYRDTNVPDWYKTEQGTSSLVGRQIHAEEESYQRWLATYKGDRNVFGHRTRPKAFATGLKLGFDRIDFNAWKDLTKQDKHSRWIEAKWTVPRILTAEEKEPLVVSPQVPLAIASSLTLNTPNRYHIKSIEIRYAHPQAGDLWAVQVQLPRHITAELLPAGMGIRLRSSRQKVPWEQALQSIRLSPGPQPGTRRLNVLLHGELNKKWLGGSLVFSLGKPLIFEVGEPTN